MEDRHQDHLLPDIQERQAVLQAGNLPGLVPDMQAAVAAGMPCPAVPTGIPAAAVQDKLQAVPPDCRICVREAGWHWR